MKVMGLAGLAPDEILNMLGPVDVAIVDTGYSLKEYVIVLGVYKFLALLKSFKPEQKIIVVDNPLNLLSTNIPTPDLVECEDVHIDGIQIKTLSSLPKFKELEKVIYKNYNIVDVATRQAKAQVTFLNQFMTFIYSLPAESHQTPVKKLVCKWMASKETFSTLQKKVAELRRTITLTEKQVARLYAILDSEVAAKYRFALQQDGEEDVVAKNLKVSAYELRYIRAINRGK